MGRAERALTGGNRIERAFLENFLYARIRELPKGMIPMSYPSAHRNGNFIVPWGFWLILELESYLSDTGDTIFIRMFRPIASGFLKFCTRYENADGLLEKLPRWVFIEWSQAAKYAQDINYPVNMLYAKALEVTAKLYDKPSLHVKAGRLKEIIRAKSFNGKFFTDNAVLQNGIPVNTGNISEICQYYAFFTGVAGIESYPALWETLVKDFGPERKRKNNYPDICLANAFIGNYLRLELLSRTGLHRQVLDECLEYFGSMADKTGTLWENDTSGAVISCCHGFASYAIVWLLRTHMQDKLS